MPLEMKQNKRRHSSEAVKVQTQHLDNYLCEQDRAVFMFFVVMSLSLCDMRIRLLSPAHAVTKSLGDIETAPF